jgi:tetratricopeptide (TPR) repeat protein
MQSGHEHSPDSVMDTPSSTASSSFVGDLVFGADQGDANQVSSQHMDVEQSPDQLTHERPDGMPTPLRSNRNETTSEASVQGKAPPSLPYAVENGTPKVEEEPQRQSHNPNLEETPKSNQTESPMQNDETPQSNKTETPQSNTTASSSPDYGSDEDSAIQDLARIMQEQQRQHKENQREVRGSRMEVPPDSVPQGRMSRLEEWQQKQKHREEKRKQDVANYLPKKYRHDESHKYVPVPTKQNGRPKLEPEPGCTQEPAGVRYFGDQGEPNLFPDMEWDEHGKVVKNARANQVSQPPARIRQEREIMNLHEVSSASEWISHPGSPSEAEDIQVPSHGLSIMKQIYRSGPHHQVPEELSLLESRDESSNNELVVNNTHSMHDDVSVISVDTELRQLAEHIPQRSRLQKQQRLHPYAIKPKDSMESDMRLDSDEDYGERPPDRTYSTLKRNDSMERDMMVIDFDEQAPPIKHKFTTSHSIDDEGVSIVDYFDDKSQAGSSVASPPAIRKQHFAFADEIEEEEEEDVMAELQSYSDDSEATNNPAIFPSKAVYQMNLGQESKNKSGCESNDLIERACELLARGLNEDALSTLNNALSSAEASMDKIKDLMDDHYYNKERGLRPPTSEQLLDQEEYEEKLDNDFRAVASDMADIMNNIGVVHELNGDYHLAMNSFRDALDVYRRTCHRYENAGDADVDRAVSNIMHMGIAMRSRERREELHLEEEDLDEMIKAADRADERMELRIERLNVLMAVLEVENESLGRSE